LATENENFGRSNFRLPPIPASPDWKIYMGPIRLCPRYSTNAGLIWRGSLCSLARTRTLADL